MIVWCLEESPAGCVEILLETFHQRFRSMELTDDVRTSQLVPDVMVPDDLPVSRIKKRNAVASVVERAFRDSPGIPLSLRENALRAEG